MLEGLDINEVLLSEIKKDNEEFRLDDDYYRKEYYSIYNKLSNYVLLKDIVSMSDVSSNGSFAYVQKVLNDDNPKVVPYIRSGNVGDTFINTSDLIKISNEAHSKLKLSSTKLHDVMMARKGKIGGASIITEQEVNYNCNENVIKLTIKDKDKINPFYFTTFFNSKYGLKQTERLSTGNVQPWVSIYQIRKMRLEVLSKVFQREIELLVTKAHQIILRSQSNYSIAENLLLNHLGISDWRLSDRTFNVKSFRLSFLLDGRIDAEYYQTKYDELEEKIKTVPYKTIAEIQQFNARGVQPDYVKEGCVSVVNSKHILEDGLDYDNFERTTEAFLSLQKRAQVGYGDILIYTTGANIGRTQAYLKNDHALASNHVNILRVKGVNPIYLALVLNSPLGRMQTEKLCTGSAQAEIYPSDIEKFVVPILDETTQESIAAKVQECFAMKAESKRLLNIAKEAVEIAISDSEEKALKHIKGL